MPQWRTATVNNILLKKKHTQNNYSDMFMNILIPAYYVVQLHGFIPWPEGLLGYREAQILKPVSDFRLILN